MRQHWFCSFAWELFSVKAPRINSKTSLAEWRILTWEMKWNGLFCIQRRRQGPFRAAETVGSTRHECPARQDEPLRISVWGRRHILFHSACEIQKACSNYSSVHLRIQTCCLLRIAKMLWNWNLRKLGWKKSQQINKAKNMNNSKPFIINCDFSRINILTKLSFLHFVQYDS